MKITDKTGALISIKNVTDENDLMIINKSGITIRLALSDLRTTGRATQGVKVINLRSNDQIASVAKVSAYKEEEKVQSEEESSDPEINTKE
jgi:DNA gyrase subunit A